MPRSEVSGHRPRAPPYWRVILVRRALHQEDDLRRKSVLMRWRRVREQNWKECEELLLNGRGRMHALDEMLHWRDPVERCRTLRRRRRTLIDDNPSSG